MSLFVARVGWRPSGDPGQAVGKDQTKSNPTFVVHLRYNPSGNGDWMPSMPADKDDSAPL